MSIEIPKIIKMKDVGFGRTSSADLILFSPLFDEDDIGSKNVSELVIGVMGHEIYPDDAKKLRDSLSQYLTLNELHLKKRG